MGPPVNSRVAERLKRKQQEKIAAGVCLFCTKPRGKTQLCDYHLKKRTAKRHALAREREANGLCVKCGRTNDRPQSNCCNKCTSDSNVNILKRAKTLVAQGLCKRCGGLPLPNQTRCLPCWANEFAARHLGSVTYANELLRLLNEQNYKCALTGEHLIPMVNASLDHKIPKSRGGTSELSNLHWVTYDVNFMKRHMTVDEFVRVATLVADLNRDKN